MCTKTTIAGLDIIIPSKEDQVLCLGWELALLSPSDGPGYKDYWHYEGLGQDFSYSCSKQWS
jgi:hypothetical protein